MSNKGNIDYQMPWGLAYTGLSDALLKKYVETNVLPNYNKNEDGHGIKHIDYVVRRSLEFAKQVENVNLDIVYTVACYHDIGHYKDAKHHEEVSAEIFIKDKNIKLISPCIYHFSDKYFLSNKNECPILFVKSIRL